MIVALHYCYCHSGGVLTDLVRMQRLDYSQQTYFHHGRRCDRLLATMVPSAGSEQCYSHDNMQVIHEATNATIRQDLLCQNQVISTLQYHH